jgi:hypothetical protein
MPFKEVIPVYSENDIKPLSRWHVKWPQNCKGLNCFTLNVTNYCHMFENEYDKINYWLHRLK